MFIDQPFIEIPDILYFFNKNDEVKNFKSIKNGNLYLLKSTLNSKDRASIFIKELKKEFFIEQVQNSLKVLSIVDFVDFDEKLLESNKYFKFQSDIIFGNIEDNQKTTFQISILGKEFQKLTSYKIETSSKTILERVEFLEQKIKKLEEIILNKDKISSSINQNSDELIWKDEITNLYWELKTDQNKNKTYNYDNAITYIDELNNINFGGFNNWRIPTKKELETLFSRKKNGDFFIKKELLKNTITKTKANYWSATENIEQSNFVWVAFFNYGYGDFKYKTHHFHLRAVRG